jgi:excisionase family DNA binding protein
MPKINEYLKIAEAARVLGVSQNTLRLWAEAGKVPVRRNPANGYRLFRKSDLEAFLMRVEAGVSSPTKPNCRSDR